MAKRRFIPNLNIEHARIIYKNFAGEGDKFTRQGDRNFSVVIDDAKLAQTLANDGWTVKIKPPREEGDDPFMYMKVKVKFGDYPPEVYLVTSSNQTQLDEESISILDDADIINVDLELSPYQWTTMEGTPDEKTGVSAYLKTMYVTIAEKENPFARKYANKELVRGQE